MEQQALTIDHPKRHTRDEMNLAEFPLTLLSTRSDPKIKTLEFKDQIKSKNGDVINREWTITGADKFGLPTASDDEVLIGLLKLSVDQGFEDRKVYFTRYELLKALQWTTEGRSYKRLMNALDRLSGVRIKAKNAFFDNSSKMHSTVNFGIIDAYEINDGRDSSGQERASFFLWSEVLYKSFQVGYIKKLDLGFYLALESAVSKRLFRYLDKHFWYKSKLTIAVFTLAHEKLGISRNYKYLSSIRQQIDPALDELVAAGFLEGYAYQGRGDDAEITISAKSTTPRYLEPKGGQKAAFEVAAAAPQSDNLEEKRRFIQRALEDRGLKAMQSARLIKDFGHVFLDKAYKIIEHFDELVHSQSKLVSRSPVGFLYRAIENPDRFMLPGEEPKKSQEHLFGGTSAGPKAVVKTAAAEGDVADKTEQKADRRAQYLMARKAEAKALRAKAEEGVLKKIRSEVEVALAKFKANISDKNFQEAVEHALEERLLNLFAFPSFEEWVRA
jgi:plasmid replication initiation protein